jgi:hypothetical protein
MKKSFFLSFLVFIACFESSNQTSEVIQSQQSTTTITLTGVENTTTTSIQQKNVKKESTNILAKPDFLSINSTTQVLDGCKPFKGSSIKIDCLSYGKILTSYTFENEVVDVSRFENNFYVILKRGQIYQLNIETGDRTLFLDYSDKISFVGEGGLLSLAFNSIGNDFVVSYVNTEGELIFELNLYENNIFEVVDKKTLLKLKNNARVHFAGNVIWSEHFNDYIASIGDFTGNSENPRFNSIPQDTSTPLGKIILLQKKVEYTNEFVDTSKKEDEQLSNIIALGLRNPWKFFEVNNQLYIFDVGLYDYEEVNVLTYDSLPQNFGWPYFEGYERSMDIEEVDSYTLDLQFDNKIYKNINEYFEYETVMPLLFYNHNVDNLANRFAVIGGDFILDPMSDFNFSIVFADFLSDEIFLYNIYDNILKIVPVENIAGATSIKHLASNKVLVTTTSGFVHIIELPNSN